MRPVFRANVEGGLIDLGELFTFFEPQFLLRMGVTPSVIGTKIKQDNVKVKVPGP